MRVLLIMVPFALLMPLTAAYSDDADLVYVDTEGGHVGVQEGHAVDIQTVSLAATTTTVEVEVEFDSLEVVDLGEIRVDFVFGEGAENGVAVVILEHGRVTHAWLQQELPGGSVILDILASYDADDRLLSATLPQAFLPAVLKKGVFLSYANPCEAVLCTHGNVGGLSDRVPSTGTLPDFDPTGGSWE